MEHHCLGPQCTTVLMIPCTGQQSLVADRDALRSELAQERSQRDTTADMLRQARADAAFENRHRQLAAEAAEEFRVERDNLSAALKEALAQNERFDKRYREAEAENDQWQKKVADLWSDIENLRAAKENA